MNASDAYRSVILALERVVSIRNPYERECSEADSKYKAAKTESTKTLQRQLAELTKRYSSELNTLERERVAAVRDLEREISELPTKIKRRIGIWKVVDLLEDSFGIEIEMLKIANPQFAKVLEDFQNTLRESLGECDARKRAIESRHITEEKRARDTAYAGQQKHSEDHQNELAALRSQYERNMQQVSSDLDSKARLCRELIGKNAGRTVSIPRDTGLVCFGECVGEYAGIKIDIPVALRFPLSRHLLLVGNETLGRARESLFHVIILQLFAACPPGRVIVSVADPEQLGKAVSPFLSLKDGDYPLVEKQIATDPSEIERLLAQVGEHIENVIQNHLGERYSSVEAYNSKSGHLFIPYRVIVLCGCMGHISKGAERHLENIILHGIKCGVFLFLVENSPPKFDEERRNLFSAVGLSGTDQLRIIPSLLPQEVMGHVQLRAATLPPKADLKEFIRSIAEEAEKATLEIGYAELLRAAGLGQPGNDLTGDARKNLSIPLGLTGPRDSLSLALGDGTLQHVLIMGKSGSGKTNLLHVLICTAACIYGPEELSLFLVDFKKGVEFQCYARERLPQAVVVGIESDRDLGVSVLRRVQTELDRRGEIFRNAGAADYPDFRSKHSEILPRIMVVFDEFQLLFDPDDEIATESKRLLDSLVKQGRAFGIHVVLATQTISGVWNMARSTVSQMAIRVALQCDEGDSRLILSDSNPAAKFLKRSGEAIYNTTNGQPDGNTRFQVAFLSPDLRVRVLAGIRKASDDAAGGSAQVPTVYDGTGFPDAQRNAPLCKWLVGEITHGRPGSVTIPLGESSDLSGFVPVTFEPEPGSNLLIAARDGNATDYFYANIGLALARLSGDTKKPVRIIAYDPGGLLAGGLSGGKVPESWTLLSRQSHVCDALDSLRQEIEREDTETAVRPPTMLIILGVHKLSDLKTDSSTAARPTVPPSPAASFAQLLRNGPELGIHFVCSTNDITNFVRNVDPQRRIISDFNHRVGFQMSDENSATMFGTRVAANLGDKKGAYQDKNENKISRFRPFDIHSLQHLK